jgi:hypothetical protein
MRYSKNALIVSGAISLFGIQSALADEVKCQAAKVPTPCIVQLDAGVGKILYLPSEEIIGTSSMVDGSSSGDWTSDVMQTHDEHGKSTAIVIRAARAGLTNRLIVSTNQGFREFVLKSVGPEKVGGL